MLDGSWPQALDPAAPACCICGAGTTVEQTGWRDRLHGTPGLFGVAQCGACGHRQTTGNLSDAVLAGAYTRTYVAHGLYRPEVAHGRRALLNRLVMRIERRRVRRMLRHVPLAKSSRVLDAGCGNGSFLLALHQNTGCRCDGVDGSAEGRCTLPVGGGIRILRGGIETQALPDGAYDAITLWHVLEHLRDPLAVLRKLRKAVRPGGHLVLGLPDSGGAAARLFGNAWFGTDLPRHLQHFNAASVCAALNAAGWSACSLRHVTEISTVGGSLHNLLGRRWCDDLAAHLFPWLALQAACMPFDHLLRVLGWGDWMMVVAVTGRKEDQ